MKRDCRKANKHSPDSLNTQLLAQNNLPTIWVIGKRQWLKHGLQSCTCTFRRHQLVLQIFKPAIQSLISTNSHLAERPWCSVGSTRRKAHQSLERLGRSQCFSLMTCCERPAFRTRDGHRFCSLQRTKRKASEAPVSVQDSDSPLSGTTVT